MNKSEDTPPLQRFQRPCKVLWGPRRLFLLVHSISNTLTSMTTWPWQKKIPKSLKRIFPPLEQGSHFALCFIRRKRVLNQNDPRKGWCAPREGPVLLAGKGRTKGRRELNDRRSADICRKGELVINATWHRRLGILMTNSNYATLLREITWSGLEVRLFCIAFNLFFVVVQITS